MGVTAIVYGTDCLEEMKYCLPVLEANSSLIDNIIAIDNHSSDGTYEWLSRDEKVTSVYFDDEVKPFSKMMNEVIGELNPEGDLLIINATFMGTANSVKRLITGLESDEELIAVTGMTDGSFGIQFLEDIHSYDELEKADKQLGDEADVAYTLGTDIEVILLRESAIGLIGLFDENLVSTQKAIEDYMLRITDIGKKVAICRNALFFSLSGANKTFAFKEYINQDTEYMYSKWNMHYFNHKPNLNLIELIDRKEDETFRVLEIGCDCGATLIEIKNRFQNAEIYGVEITKRAAKLASLYMETCTNNIEDYNLEYPDSYFDYIIFGDVLEHLRNPEGAIDYCRSLLKPNGCIIASIPNLMHFSVLRGLIDGDFTYTDTGLLDKTHIHFFTYNEIVRMFNKLDYELDDMSCTIIAVSEDDSHFISQLMQITRGAEEFMFTAFQYIIRARVKGEEKRR